MCVPTQCSSRITRHTGLPNQNTKCASPCALKPHKEIKKQAGQATPAFTVPLKVTTCDCRLYIGNLRHICQGVRGMIFSFPKATQWQTFSVLRAAVAFAARMIGVFFSTWIKEGSRTGNCGRQNGFRSLATERTQTANTNCSGSVRTRNDDRRRPDFFKDAVFKER